MTKIIFLRVEGKTRKERPRIKLENAIQSKQQSKETMAEIKVIYRD